MPYRKRDPRPKNKFNKSKPKQRKPKPPNKNEKQPKRHRRKRKRPLRRRRRRSQQNCLNLYKCKKCRLAWIRRPSCVYSTSKGTVIKGGSASLVMILVWSGKGRRKIYIRTRGKGRMMSRRRRMIWLIGMKVHISLPVPVIPITALGEVPC